MIMIVAFVLLLVVFRSLTIAISSMLLNLLGVAASFGFATLVFQHGWGTGLIGIEPQGFVDAWAPLFFFALLFGLSMDYQLFLLAAIKERYEATGDAQLAVREGIARTGRPITNAALIMIVVFIAFGVTGPIPPTELGITLALAVLLDATVIRMMLVPSLLGHARRAQLVAPRLARPSASPTSTSPTEPARPHDVRTAPVGRRYPRRYLARPPEGRPPWNCPTRSSKTSANGCTA